MKKIRLPVVREVVLQLSRINGRIEFEGTALKATTRHSNAQRVKPLPAGSLLVTLWLPEHLVARFKAVEIARRETLGQFASALIHWATQDVALSSEDFRQIAHDMREVETAGAA